MAVSKIDILNKAFGRSFRGYTCADVDAFLQDVADTMGELAENNRGLENRISMLEQALEEHKSREKTLRDTLMTTQKMMDDMKATAQKEAQLIIDAANAKAETLLNQAHNRLAQIHGDISELKKQRTQFEVKLRSILDAHLRMLELDRQEEETLDAAEQKLKFLKKANV
ncbi:DivIVA domain-containing protein [Desulfobaculum bizertense]|uniref:Cell division initiation protein n=1 Tax=Desulfobaculum bizertense DSM 18034 TaxID=1121442 RepID=A0A1T4WV65_9BACT|nr:DivIVA domain-containing protein [Desulfobaculum bizertense]UIJ38620.1 DivIVA domain-containing protein [Desulfobaculum bizertense]SKA81243.1 cell division initiation protein [Desulfobaculum bizertense DSM 18034]